MTASVGGNNPLPKRLPLAGPMASKGAELAAAEVAEKLAAPKLAAAGDGLADAVAKLGAQGPEGLGEFSFDGPMAENHGASAAAQAAKAAASKAFQSAMGQMPPDWGAAAKAATDVLKAAGGAAQAYQQMMNQVPPGQRAELAQNMLGQLAQKPTSANGLPRDMLGDLGRAATQGPGIVPEAMAMAQVHLAALQEASTAPFFHE